MQCSHKSNWELEYAEQSGDIQKVQELQRKIDELDSRADILDRQRSQYLTGVTWINQRNRDYMKQSFLSGIASTEAKNEEDDPFTRKSGKQRVVSGTSKAKRTIAIAEAAAASKIGTASISATDSPLPTPSPIALITKKPGPLPGITDLFSAHDIEIDIQLKLPAAGPSRVPSIDSQPSRVITRPAGSRSITLEEYKRKRGLI
ncbi:RNA polymerase-associated protein RTF1 like protein [Ditylenchus destructor]|nr:RNA polymerase-associated protein RTF1 like protein [Ditylenchus destructor]